MKSLADETLYRANFLTEVLHLRANLQPDRLAFAFLHGKDGERGWTYATLDRRARAVAALLRELGRKGDRVALFFPPGLDFIGAFLGCLHAGMVAVPLYPPQPQKIRDPRKVAGLMRALVDSGAGHALTLQMLHPFIDGLLRGAGSALEIGVHAADRFPEEPDFQFTPDAVGERDLAFLQYTSGSTGSPKGVMITHANLMANMRMISEGFRTGPEDIGLNWLPFYHDMGLIGTVLNALYQGIPSILMPPLSFIKDPLGWLDAITRFRATICGGPNFAYELCVQKARDERLRSLDLRSWRLAFNGAEPVRAATLRRFSEKFAHAGFRERAFYPCYGMAETTLMVSGGRPEDEPVILAVEKESLETGRAVAATESAEARRLVGCGRALSDGRFLVVAPESLEPRPEGAVGEILVGGPHVARGYWNRKEESERVFGISVNGGGPYLRTGDLGFVRDGELFVTGRLKDLIIVRGRNHFPQDIEITAQQAHDDLKPGGGAAFTLSEADEDRLIVVHEVRRRSLRGLDTPAVEEAVRAAVATAHALRVDRVVLIKPGSLPKTSSGKVRRFACRKALLGGTLAVVPGGSPERKPPSSTQPADQDGNQVPWILRLRQILAETLKLPLESVGPGQTPPQLGVDSVTAAEIQQLLETKWRIALPVTDFLEGNTVAELAETCASGEVVPVADAPPRDPRQPFPLTANQKALWFLQALAPESSAYNLFFAVTIRGELAENRVREVFQCLVDRHPSLRATFFLRDDEPYQRLRDEHTLDFQELDARDWPSGRVSGYLSNEAHRPFDLERDRLLRLRLLRRGGSRWTLLLAVHHIAVDFWSMLVLMDEAGALLGGNAERLPPLTRGYADYVHEQTVQLEGPEGRRLREYWERRLSPPLPVLELPTDRPRPEVLSYRGAAQPFSLDREITERLRKVVGETDTTMYTVLLAAFLTLLHKYTGQSRLLVGSPAGGRTRARDRSVVGYFVNPVVLSADLSDGAAKSFRDLVGQVRQTVLEALAHQELPFQQLVERLHPRRDPSRSPLFQVMFTYLRPHRLANAAPFALREAGATMTLGGLTVESHPLPQKVAQLDLTLLITEGEDRLFGSFEYSTDLFEAATIGRMADAIRYLLSAVLDDTASPLWRLPLTGAGERHRMVMEWNAMPASVAGGAGTLASLANLAVRSPDKIALVFRDRQWSYGALWRRVESIAGRLARLGVGPESVVGLLFDRSDLLPAAMLAVLRSGAAYLPLDPEYPASRLALLVEDAEPAAMLTLRSLRDGGRRIPEICLDEARDPDRAPLPASAFPADLPAYVIYTSGSTGRPKGVCVTRGSLEKFFGAMDEVLNPGSDSGDPGSWLAVTNVSFDIAALELLWTLARGFKLVVQNTAEAALFPPSRGRRSPGQPMAFSLFYFADEEGARQDKYRLLMDGARFADRHGFSAVWTPERHFHSFGGLYPNPSVAGAAVAAVTSRVHIRAGSVVLPLHDPVRVAEEWSFVDNLSGGRVGISVASGWNADDFVFRPEHFARNKEVMIEQLGTVRRLWRGESISLTGGHGRHVDISIRPRPVQPDLPVWLTAAGSPETFRTAGRLGAKVLTHLLGQDLAELAGKIAEYREAWRAAGHPGNGFVTLMLHTYVAEDMASVRETVRIPFQNYLGRSLGLMKGLAHSLGLDMDSDHFTDEARETLLSHAFERYFESGTLFGTPDHCLAMVGGLEEIGVDEVACLIDFGIDYDTTMNGLSYLNELRQKVASTAASDPADYSLPAQVLGHGITHLQATPSLVRMLLGHREVGEAFGRLRCCLIGGEALPPSLARELRGLTRARILNMYGPTETTIWSTTQRIRGDEIAIGRPLANTRAYIVDRWLEPRPVGLPGELLLGGGSLARGYGKRPELTAVRFAPNPFARQEPGARLYRTGDLASYLPDGTIRFHGRLDDQVKLHGHRIEPGEIEKALAGHPDVAEAVVTVHRDILVAHFTGRPDPKPGYREFLLEILPVYMVPSVFRRWESLPLTPSGKIDRVKLASESEHPASTGSGPQTASGAAMPQTRLERSIAAVWREVLGLERVGIDDSFFDLGGHSLRLAQAHRKLRETVDDKLSMVDMFRFPTIRGLAGHLAGGGSRSKGAATVAVAPPPPAAASAEASIAVIGMACRFPGASDPERYWENLRNGVESITFFTDEELLASGVHPSLLGQENYVKAGAILEKIEEFDAGFFGFSPREASLLDPQHRLFLECAWEALEHAGCDPDRYPGRIGVFAGSGMNTYLLNNLYSHRAGFAEDSFQLMIANDKDFLPTRAAHCLNLKGPGVSVQTGCSTSLVALDLACRALRAGQCEMALAGAASVRVPQKEGYLHQEGMIASPDGHCRAFDARAGGTLFGSGVGLVVLKPLDKALADGDRVDAVIRGSAINNDGADKIGYTAPGVAGQTTVIASALAAASVNPEHIDYVEAHGTGTELGDPIELEALTLAFGSHTDRKGYCAIGSAKTNFGHLDTAAGAAGLIKTVLALKHRQIPPSLHFEEPNTEIDFAGSPFYVNGSLAAWPERGRPRLAGVSSFGIGGTNAHVILEEAPEPSQPEPSGTRDRYPLLLSARSIEALDQMSGRLADHLESRRDLALADLAFTLQTGRKRFEYRRSLAAATLEEAVAKLRANDPSDVFTHYSENRSAPVVFMFPGGGAQYLNMGRDLYRSEAVFRETFDACAEVLAPHLDGRLHDWIFTEDRGGEAGRRITGTSLALPALFTVEYAAARLVMSWGIVPAAMIGHSMGEYVAACLAGVFSLEDALALVVERGRLFELLPKGGMISIPLPAERVRDLMQRDLCFAAINSASECVVSGPLPELDAFAARLDHYGIEYRRLLIDVAAHSRMVRQIVPDFTRFVANLPRHAPRIPFISNVTGSWTTDEQARDPAHWGRQLADTVLFGKGIERLLAEEDNLFLEIGPGRTLTTLTKHHAGRNRLILPTMRHPYDRIGDDAFLCDTLGKLWTGGVAVDWRAFAGEPLPRKLPLPGYPYQRSRCWLEPRPERDPPGHQGKNPIIDQWFYLPVWRGTAPKNPTSLEARTGGPGRWLVFDDGKLGLEVAARLVESGAEVVRAIRGDRFEAGTHFALRPDFPEDYEALFAELEQRDWQPETALHFWSYGNAAPDGETERKRGYYSILGMVQAFSRGKEDSALDLWVVGSGLLPVESGDLVLPDRAALLGPCAVVPQEFERIACRLVDLPAAKESAEVQERELDLLFAELTEPGKDRTVAIRDCRRLVPEYEPMPLAKETLAVRPFREGGTYLITGGLGGVGSLLAEFMAREYRARLVLVGRSGLPDTERMEAGSGLQADASTARKIRTVRRCRELGAEVLVLKADVAQGDELREAIERARRQFGPLHGVVHAAGLAGVETVQPIPEIGREDSERQFQAKVRGTCNLAEALREENPDFVLLVSSNVTVLGGLGAAAYTAANAFLDAFAVMMHGRGKPWISAAWDGWLSGEEPEDARSYQTSIDRYAMLPLESVEAFRRVAGSARVPRVVVSSGDLKTRLRQWTRGPEDDVEDAKPKQARPALGIECIPPENELQERILAIWRDVLGIEELGIADNFFDLGGNSLIALKVVAKLKKELAREIPVVALFEGPTVRALAEVLSESRPSSPETGPNRGERRRNRRRTRKLEVRG